MVLLKSKILPHDIAKFEEMQCSTLTSHPSGIGFICEVMCTVKVCFVEQTRKFAILQTQEEEKERERQGSPWGNAVPFETEFFIEYSLESFLPGGHTITELGLQFVYRIESQ